MNTDELNTLETLREQLGRLTAIVAKLHVLEDRPNVRGGGKMGVELVKLADELHAPMSHQTRETILRGADACGVAL